MLVFKRFLRQHSPALCHLRDSIPSRTKRRGWRTRWLGRGCWVPPSPSPTSARYWKYEARKNDARKVL